MTTGTLTSATTAKPLSKSAAVIKLLTRARGATVAEIQAATDWQPHSVRAYLSGLRKTGRTLDKEERKTGETSYRICALVSAPGAGSAPSPAGATDNPAADADAGATA